MTPFGGVGNIPHMTSMSSVEGIGKQFTVRLDENLRSRVSRVTKIRSSPRYGDWNLGNSRSITRLIERGLEAAERAAKLAPPTPPPAEQDIPADTSIRLPSELVHRIEAYLKAVGSDASGHKALLELLRLGVDVEEKRLVQLAKKRKKGA